MALKGITRHPDLWFDDGSVILIAEDTGFRVYRGVLARHSEVFRDTFQIPQSTAVDVTEEHCLVVHLSDDSAEEITIMLNILFTSGHRHDVQIDFPTAAAALRLGTKYGIEEMKQEALCRISACYTKDLARLRTHEGDSDNATECPISWKAEDCMGVLHLARQLDLDELIPAALYRCANDVTLDQIFQAAAEHQRLHTLTFQELQDCVCSRNDLITENIKLYDMFSELQPSAKCSAAKPKGKDESTCIQTMRRMVWCAHKDGFFHGSLALHPMDKWIDDWTKPGQICPSCGEHFKCTNALRRSEIWSLLASKYCESRKPIEPKSSPDVASSNT